MRSKTADDFLTYVLRHPGIHVGTCRDIAAWWKYAHPLAEPANAGTAAFDASLARG